jgi:hypothetical protein
MWRASVKIDRWYSMTGNGIFDSLEMARNWALKEVNRLENEGHDRDRLAMIFDDMKPKHKGDYENET